MTNALLIHAGAVGDFIMALRIVAALRQAGARRVAVLGQAWTTSGKPYHDSSQLRRRPP